MAKAKTIKYAVKWSLKLDGKSYAPGDTVELDAAAPLAAHLLSGGVIERIHNDTPAKIASTSEGAPGGDSAAAPAPDNSKGEKERK